MHLTDLNLFNFKNYPQAALELHPRFNALTGPNGSGKTNILDAVHYLCLCKSAFNLLDQQNIMHDAPSMLVSGVWQSVAPKALPDPDKNPDGRTFTSSISPKTEKITCALERGGKKKMAHDGKDYPRLADHIGKYPIVLISPYDHVLLSGGAEERRKFLDQSIAQLDPMYLDSLVRYQRALNQRNAVLKKISEGQRPDPDLLDALDTEMLRAGVPVLQTRAAFIRDFAPWFYDTHASLTANGEKVELQYLTGLAVGGSEASSPLPEDYPRVLLSARPVDQRSGRSGTGPHKADLDFLLEGRPIRRYGSQGQQKSALIALKMAQYSYLKDRSGKAPVLLLDDIFDKLDDHRVHQLMNWVNTRDFGQVFMTDTGFERIQDLWQENGLAGSIFKVQDGAVQERVLFKPGSKSTSTQKKGGKKKN